MAEKGKSDKAWDNMTEKEWGCLPLGTASHNNILLFTMVKKRTILHRVVVLLKRYAPKDIPYINYLGKHRLSYLQLI